MKLNNDFLVHTSGNETVVVPTGKAAFSGIVKGNLTLGAMLEILKNDVSEEELIKKMKEHYDAPDGAIEKDIRKLLGSLRKIGALDE